MTFRRMLSRLLCQGKGGKGHRQSRSYQQSLFPKEETVSFILMLISEHLRVLRPEPKRWENVPSGLLRYNA